MIYLHTCSSQHLYKSKRLGCWQSIFCIKAYFYKRFWRMKYRRSFPKRQRCSKSYSHDLLFYNLVNNKIFFLLNPIEKYNRKQVSFFLFHTSVFQRANVITKASK